MTGCAGEPTGVVASGSGLPVFALVDGVPTGGTPDVLGPWAVVPELAAGSPAGALAFDLGAGAGGAAGTVSVWRADLPADRRLAVARVAGGEERQAAAEDALTEAAARLDALIASRAAASFDVSGEPAPAEAALLGALAELEGERTAISYGLGDALAGGWARAEAQFEAGAARLRQLVAGDAWVETRVEGLLLGRTAVGWTGDAETVWAIRGDPALGELHGRTVGLVLASRAATLRALALAARGAVTLSVLLAPGGALLALPAAWRFVTDVVHQVEASRGRKQERMKGVGRGQ